jgi:hypothetical protein
MKPDINQTWGENLNRIRSLPRSPATVSALKMAHGIVEFRPSRFYWFDTQNRRARHTQSGAAADGINL